MIINSFQIAKQHSQLQRGITMKKLYCICTVLLVGSASFAGTLIFKNGTRISGIEIVSISGGQIIIEKDKTKKTYAVSKLKSFYRTDLKSTTEDMPGEFADYTVKIIDVKMPKKGVDSKGKTSKCEINYTISKKGKGEKVKVPYFYLYVITPGKNEVSGRQIYRFIYPKQAKPKGKGYDEAAIMAKLTEFSRPTWHSDRHNLRGKLHGKTISFELSGVKKRPILAWHLEIWGNGEKLVSKDQNMMQLNGHKVSKNWWKKH